MIELSEKDIHQINAGFKLNLGTAIFSVAAGFILGGPVGAGMAVCVVVGGQGINNLEEMYYNEFKH